MDVSNYTSMDSLTIKNKLWIVKDIYNNFRMLAIWHIICWFYPKPYIFLTNKRCVHNFIHKTKFHSSQHFDKKKNENEKKK